MLFSHERSVLELSGSGFQYGSRATFHASMIFSGSHMFPWVEQNRDRTAGQPAGQDKRNYLFEKKGETYINAMMPMAANEY